jgi:hypothetical protein
MVDELSTELKLNPDQRQQDRKRYSVDTRQQFQDLRRQYNPQMVQIRNASRERIAALLTPQQKTDFRSVEPAQRRAQGASQGR